MNKRDEHADKDLRLAQEEFENYDPRDDQIQELSELVVELTNDNSLLKDRILAKLKPSPNDGTIDIGQIIECLEKEIRFLQADIRVLTASRDAFMRQASENMQNFLYWRKRAKKLEAQITARQNHV